MNFRIPVCPQHPRRATDAALEQTRIAELFGVAAALRRQRAAVLHRSLFRSCAAGAMRPTFFFVL